MISDEKITVTDWKGNWVYFDKSYSILSVEELIKKFNETISYKENQDDTANCQL